MRLIGAVLVEIDEVWSFGSRYFDMADYWEWKANTEKQRKEVKSTDTRVSAHLKRGDLAYQGNLHQNSDVTKERVVGIFPDEGAALRLLGAVLMEIDEASATSYRYLNMAEYLAWMKVPKQGETTQHRKNWLEVA